MIGAGPPAENFGRTHRTRPIKPFQPYDDEPISSQKVKHACRYRIRARWMLVFGRPTCRTPARRPPHAIALDSAWLPELAGRSCLPLNLPATHVVHACRPPQAITLASAWLPELAGCSCLPSASRACRQPTIGDATSRRPVAASRTARHSTIMCHLPRLHHRRLAALVVAFYIAGCSFCHCRL